MSAATCICSSIALDFDVGVIIEHSEWWYCSVDGQED